MIPDIGDMCVRVLVSGGSSLWWWWCADWFYIILNDFAQTRKKCNNMSVQLYIHSIMNAFWFIWEHFIVTDFTNCISTVLS